MKIKKMILLCLLFVLCYNMSASADNAEIIADVSISNGGIYASGTITGVEYPCSMLIMVFKSGENYTKENVVCIGSGSTDEEGNFEIVSNTGQLPYGQYVYMIGTDASDIVKTGYLDYQYIPEYTTAEVFQADITLEIIDSVPVIRGWLTYSNNYELDLLIKDPKYYKDFVMYYKTIDDGYKSFELELSPLNEISKREFQILSGNSDGSYAEIMFDIDEHLLYSILSGDIIISDDLYLEVNMSANNIGSENVSFTENDSFSLNLPKLMSGLSFNINIKGYETVPVGVTKSKYQVRGKIGDEFDIYAMAEQVPSFHNKVYVLEYEPSEIEPVNYFGLESKNILGTGQFGNVKIINAVPGKIKFNIENIIINPGKTWTGLLNIFEFRFIKDTTTELTLKREQERP